MTAKPLLAAATAAALFAGPAQAQDLPSTDLAYVGSWSSLSLFKNFEEPFWSEHLEEASDGQVQVEVTTFDQMGLTGGEVFTRLSRGVFDVGTTVGDYTVSDAPELEGMDMPMIAPDVATAREIVDAYRPVLEDIMSERFGGAKLITAVPYPSQMVFCNAEIGGLDDLEGMTVRASGRSTAEFIEAIGAEGVTLAFSEVAGALERGVIDCAVSGSLSGYSSGWHEVSTHLYALPVGGWDFVITAMNGDKWDELGSELQQWLLAEADEHYQEPVWSNAVEETEQGIACLTGEGDCERGEAGDMTLVEASEEDFEFARRTLEEDVLPRWAERVDDAAVEAWNETIGEVTGITAGADG